jgi:hypothetical protein
MPKDIGLIAAFLASDEARWLTGEIIFGSGGLQELMTDPAVLSKLGAIGRYNPFRAGLALFNKECRRSQK